MAAAIGQSEVKKTRQTGRGMVRGMLKVNWGSCTSCDKESRRVVVCGKWCEGLDVKVVVDGRDATSRRNAFRCFQSCGAEEATQVLAQTK